MKHLYSNITVDGIQFQWWIERQPQWCHEDGWKGLLIGIHLLNQNSRTAFIQFPFKVESRRSAPHQQRLKIYPHEIYKYIKQAMAAGWDPKSKGKPVTYKITKHT